MADPEFEVRLGRMFAETPAMPDPEGFALRVQGRLDWSWTLRQLLIGAAGLGGGAVAAVQMLDARLFQDIGRLTGSSAEALTRGGRALGELKVLTALPVGSEVLWVGAALAALAVVLVATRSLEEI